MQPLLIQLDPHLAESDLTLEQLLVQELLIHATSLQLLVYITELVQQMRALLLQSLACQLKLLLQVFL